MKRAFTLVALAVLAAPASAYTVQQGDTLYALAKRAGITVDALRNLNGLTSDNIAVGQDLRLPSENRSAAPKAGTSGELPGVRVIAPATLRQGDVFTLRLSGARAGEARVRFLSERGEDVRSPAEDLAPFGAAGEYAVLGRVVLGKTTPLRYEVRLGDARLSGSIPVSKLGWRIQYLNLPPEIAGKRQDPGRASEEALVEKLYARRTPQAWTRPFLAWNPAARISTQFGQTRTYTKGEALAYHYGIDYPEKAGTPVRAMNDGTVVIAGFYPVRGGLVAIDHGLGVVSLYFHQSKIVVKVGDQVARGQKLGEVGTTGLSNAPHLHLEMRVRGEGVNPAEWYGKLLP